MLIQPLIEKICTDSAVKVEFDIRRCLRSRFNKNNCVHCLQVCRSGALELHEKHIVFDAEKCTSCMRCTAVCPRDAFVGSIDILSLLQDLSNRNEPVLLSCEKRTDSNDRIAIPCVGFFSEPLLAAINSVVRRKCFIDTSRCAECVNNHCLTALYRNMENAIHKIKGNGEVRLECHVDKQFDSAADGKNGRRSFLRMIRKTITSMGKDTLNFQFSDSEKTEDSHSKKKGRDISALLYSFSALSDRELSEKETLLQYFFSVSTDDHCDCCPLCTGMCPTGALKRKKENGMKYLTFTSGDCSGCGLCVDFCRKDALVLKSGFSRDPGIPLQIKTC